jgi:hypothetical protein
LRNVTWKRRLPHGQVVTAVHGDNISKLLSKRGVRLHETHTWLNRVRRLNPHIGNPDRIWPGDRILLPDSPMETVSEQKVWENVLSRVPAELKHPRGAHTVLYFTVPGGCRRAPNARCCSTTIRP